MKERFGQVKEYVGKLSRRTRIIILSVAVLLIVGAVSAALLLNNQTYEVLFTDLGAEEASQIAQKLQEQGTEYKFQGDSTILVPSEQVDLVKAQLVQEGYPKSGFTYDTFTENAGMMTTDSDKNTYKLYELQDRIGATIRLFDGVKDAKVTIALGEESRYVLNDEAEKETSATAVVTMKDGGSPTEEQAAGIQRLVAMSIPGMELTDVAVFDGNGNDITGEGEDQASDASDAEEVAQVVEGQIESKVESVLGAIYGDQNVSASAKAQINMERLVRETITYETPEKIDEEDKDGIISHEEGIYEESQSEGAAQGVAGAETNADTPEYNTNGAGNTTSQESESYSRDYLVNQIKEQGQVDPGVLDDLTISVAINGADYGALDEDQVRELIRNAAGITERNQDTKISVVAAPFYRNADGIQEEEEPAAGEEEPIPWMIIAVIGGAVLLLLVLIIILAARRRKKKKAQIAAEMAYAAELMQQKPGDEDLTQEILDIQNDRGMELKYNIRDFADQNPEISAQLLKTWLNGGGDQNGN